MPGGMEAHVHTVPVPHVQDRVIIGPIEIPMREFCELVEHVLTATPLKPNDSRARLLDRLENNVTRTGITGRQVVILDQPAALAV
jgi:hypothetical protein